MSRLAEARRGDEAVRRRRMQRSRDEVGVRHDGALGRKDGSLRGAPQHREERPLRLVQRLAQVAKLPFHEKAGHRRL